MSTGGIVTAITVLVTLVSALIGSGVAIIGLRHSVAKEHANRRIALEAYADEVGRYIRRLRAYLLERLKWGTECPHCGKHIDNALDVAHVDMSYFVPPPQPTYNGK